MATIVLNLINVPILQRFALEYVAQLGPGLMTSKVIDTGLQPANGYILDYQPIADLYNKNKDSDFSTSKFMMRAQLMDGLWRKYFSPFFLPTPDLVVIWDVQGGTMPELKAKFSIDIIKGVAPFTAIFKDTSEGGPDIWNWQFGDLGTSIEQNPTHIYTQPGIYTITLTIYKGQGISKAVKLDLIEVLPPEEPPPEEPPPEEPPPIQPSNWWWLLLLLGIPAALAAIKKRKKK